MPARPSPSRSRRRHGARAVSGAVAVLALTSGCGAAVAVLTDEPGDAEHEEPGGELTTASDEDVFSLQVGDCLDHTAMSDVPTHDVLPVTPCSHEHDGEIYAELVLPAGDYPGDDVVGAQADQFCLEQFEPFVGTAYDDSAFFYWPLTPTAETWETVDDRVVLCVLDTDGELVTGSLQGSAR